MISINLTGSTNKYLFFYFFFKMSKVKLNQEFLNFLCKSKPKIQKSLINNASKSQIDSICEIILNILNGNLNLNGVDYNRLNSKKSLLRTLVKRGPLKKKKYLIQKGGFLQVLIPSIIAGLATVISSIIEKV